MTRAGLSFLISILALLAIGLVVLASASGAYGLYLYNDAWHFIIRQGIWVGVSIAVGVAAYFFDYHKWREMPWLTVLLYLVVCETLLHLRYSYSQPLPPLKIW